MAETEDDNKPEELNPEETDALENTEEAEAEERVLRTGMSRGSGCRPAFVDLLRDEGLREEGVPAATPGV